MFADPTIKLNALIKLSELIDQGINTSTGEDTPLRFAAFMGFTAQLRLLIDKKADVNLAASNGDSALILAAMNGHLECLKLLINANAQINAQTKDGNNALHFAADRGRDTCAEYLLESKADIDATNSSGNTAAQLAALGNHPSSLQQLINAKADINKELKNSSLLINATIKDQPDIISCLTRAGADTSIMDDCGSFLHYAAANYGKTACVQAFFTATRSINNKILNQKNKTGFTALHFAAMQGNLPIVQILIWEQADVNIPGAVNQTPLHEALAIGERFSQALTTCPTLTLQWFTEQKLRVARYLIMAGATVDDIAHRIAQINRISEKLKHFWDRKNAYNKRQNNGPSLLLQSNACINLFRKRMSLKDALGEEDINQKDQYDQTFLHLAVHYDMPEIITGLLEAKADAAVFNKSDQTFLHYAVIEGNQACVKAFLSFQMQATAQRAIFNKKNTKGYAALHYGIYFKQLEIISLLIAAGATIDPNAQKLAATNNIDLSPGLTTPSSSTPLSSVATQPEHDSKPETPSSLPTKTHTTKSKKKKQKKNAKSTVSKKRKDNDAATPPEDSEEEEKHDLSEDDETQLFPEIANATPKLPPVQKKATASAAGLPASEKKPGVSELFYSIETTLRQLHDKIFNIKKGSAPKITLKLSKTDNIRLINLLQKKDFKNAKFTDLRNYINSLLETEPFKAKTTTYTRFIGELDSFNIRSIFETISHLISPPAKMTPTIIPSKNSAKKPSVMGVPIESKATSTDSSSTQSNNPVSTISISSPPELDKRPASARPFRPEDDGEPSVKPALPKRSMSAPHIRSHYQQSIGIFSSVESKPAPFKLSAQAKPFSPTNRLSSGNLSSASTSSGSTPPQSASPKSTSSGSESSNDSRYKALLIKRKPRPSV